MLLEPETGHRGKQWDSHEVTQRARWRLALGTQDHCTHALMVRRGGSDQSSAHSLLPVGSPVGTAPDRPTSSDCAPSAVVGVWTIVLQDA